MVKCYLCDKDSDGEYCFYCHRPICDEHAKWAGNKKFAYCPLDDSEFYKPLYAFFDHLKKYANDKKIDKKKIIISLIEKVTDCFL